MNKPNLPPVAEASALRSRRQPLLILLIAGLGAAALLLGVNLRRGINHDEHQFIAAGKLIADGLRPYIDFPYFHAPTLGYLYAALFTYFPLLLLGARLFSVACGLLSVILVAGFAYRRLTHSMRLLGALSVGGLFFAAPLFVHTSGRAWNHDLPMLLLLLAILAFAGGNASSGKRRGFAALLCGLLIGLATGVRLSFALLAPAFVLAPWIAALAARRKRKPPSLFHWAALIRANVLFSGGFLLGLAPVLWAAWPDPAAFLFDNVAYIRLNTQYYRSLPQPPLAMDLIGKVRYCLELLALQPGNLLLIAAAAGMIWPARRSGRRAADAENSASAARLQQRWLLILLLIFGFVAALGATPSQWQYFYPLLPLLLLIAVQHFAAHPIAVQQRRSRWLAGAAVLALGLALPTYLPGLTILFTPSEWIPLKVHERSQEVAVLSDGGRVLTLAPVHALESDTPIYPQLATGPFAWRVADQLSPAQRKQFGLLAAADLAALWTEQPPRGVLVGAAEDDAAEEAPLIAVAQAHGYVPIPLADKQTIWLAPLHEWDGSIRLGGYLWPRTPVRRSEQFVATFYLQNIRPIANNLNVLIRLVDRDGAELLRSEGWPWGAATSTWQVGDVWPDGHEFTVPAQAAAGVYRLEMSFYDPATLNTVGDVATIDYLLVRAEDAQTPTPLVRFGDQLALLATAINPAPATPFHAGESLTVNFSWQALTRPAGDYTIFLHIIRPDGTLLVQQDQPPLGGFYPTHFWRPGYPVNDEITVVLPTDAPPGHYRIVSGLYDAATGTRLPIIQNGQNTSDSFTIAEIEIQ